MSPTASDVAHGLHAASDVPSCQILIPPCVIVIKIMIYLLFVHKFGPIISVLEDKFTFMEVNENFPAYHGPLNTTDAIARLRTIDRQGAYLVRFRTKDFILSYITETGEIKHKIINFARNSSLRQANPSLNSLKATVDFLTSIDLHR